MSSMNIQWKLGKPFGVLSILAGFAILTQIPVIYHAREILEVMEYSYLAAYIIVTVAAVFTITNASMLLYEGLLIRMRSFDIKDYRAPFLSVVIVNTAYFVIYYGTFGILNNVSQFDQLASVAQYAFCQMIALLLIMIITLWYNKRQIKF